LTLHPKMKLGLGIGCGVLIFIFLVLFGGTIYFAKEMGKQYKEVKELEQQLVESHGKSDELPAGYTGLPTVERMEVFVNVRQETAEWRQLVETSFAELLANEGDADAKGLKHFLRLVKASRDLAPVFSGFWTSRNQAMLEGEMGMGEYIYLYHLTYNSWLGKDPSDGARDAGAFLSGLGATGALEPTSDSDDDTFNEMQRRQWAFQQVNRLMLPLMQGAARNASASSHPAVLTWAEQLQQEIREMQDDPERLPFAFGLPLQIDRSFELYRARLEANYSVTVNPVELLFEDTWEGEEELSD